MSLYSTQIAEDAMAIISSDGTVLWIPSYLFRSTCSTRKDAKDFVCHLKVRGGGYLPLHDSRADCIHSGKFKMNKEVDSFLSEKVRNLPLT